MNHPKTSLKSISLSIIANGVITFTLGFLVAFTKLDAWGTSTEVSALDVAILASVASMFLQSMGGLVINNFSFLNQGKNWRDFWSKGVFEVFRKDNGLITEPWRIARGKVIINFVLILFEFLIIYLYQLVRSVP